MIHDIFTYLSLVLTPLTIVGCVGVAIFYFRSATRALVEPEKTEMHWLLMGIFIGFLGSSVDNLYWGLAWTAEYLKHPIKEDLFHYGVMSNLPFRQLTTLAAAYCHIRAAIETDSRLFRFTLYGGWALSLGFAWFLL